MIKILSSVKAARLQEEMKRMNVWDPRTNPEEITKNDRAAGNLDDPEYDGYSRILNNIYFRVNRNNFLGPFNSSLSYFPNVYFSNFLFRITFKVPEDQEED